MSRVDPVHIRECDEITARLRPAAISTLGSAVIQVFLCPEHPLMLWTEVSIHIMTTENEWIHLQTAMRMLPGPQYVRAGYDFMEAELRAQLQDLLWQW